MGLLVRIIFVGTTQLAAAVQRRHVTDRTFASATSDPKKKKRNRDAIYPPN
jgi:hypothetical protein